MQWMSKCVCGLFGYKYLCGHVPIEEKNSFVNILVTHLHSAGDWD